MTATLLVTGGSGFVGGRVLRRLGGDQRYSVRAASRSRVQALPASATQYRIKDFAESTDWSGCLVGVDVVVHCAARVHVMKEVCDNPLMQFRSVNVEGSLNFARQAAVAGVRRFVFISSIKVNGEDTNSRSPFSPEDLPDPQDAYAISKLEAEEGLKAIANETGMEVVIVRPPLVYGPGVKGNFASMVKMVKKGLPLPLGAVHNKRSLVALDNLVDLIVTCIDHPSAANQVFLAGDGEDLSTTELLRGIAQAIGQPSRLLSIPTGMLMFCATLIGKRGVAQRLLGSLQVDISKARNLLEWQPPLSVEEGLAKAVVDQSGQPDSLRNVQ